MRASMRWVWGGVAVAWVVASMQPLRSELATARAMPSVWKMDASDRKRLVDGPIYELLEHARRLIPEDSGQQVYLFAVDDGYTYYKANYYLYPRTLHLMDPADAEPQALSPGSYFIFFIPSAVAAARPQDIQRDFDRVAARLPAAVKLHRTPNAGIYRVASRHG